VIPLGLFLIPSVNPQSWLFTGTFTSWVLIWLALTQTDRRRLIWTLVFAFFAIGLAVASRSDGPLIEVVVIISVTVIASSEKRLIKQRLLPVAIAGFVLLVWKNSQLVSALKNSLVEQGSGFFAPYYTLHNLPRMIEFYFGDFATRIGDSDTGMPPIVVLGALLIFVVLLLWAMRSVGRARGVVAIGLLSLLIFVPVLVLNNARYQIGGLFLPRYMWPFLFGFVFVLSSNIRRKSDALSLGEAGLVVGAFVPSAIAAQFILVKRYTVSASSTSWDLDADKLWWWSWGPSPLTAVALGAIFATVFIFGVVTLIAISERNTINDLA
ncbi:MAG: DUF2142 domain-containing protein, partial [Acidimicrobiaceae bacterium]|nr:DUF2142 domain-containing protein [Acidimicrobiaceae bacterium]